MSYLTSPNILLHLFCVWCVCMHLCLFMWVGTCTMVYVWREFSPPTWESLGLDTGHHVWQQQPLLTDHRCGSSSCPEQYLTLWTHCDDSLPWPFPVSARYEHRCCEHLFEAKGFQFSSIKTQKWNNWVIISRGCLSSWEMASLILRFTWILQLSSIIFFALWGSRFTPTFHSESTFVHGVLLFCVTLNDSPPVGSQI